MAKLLLTNGKQQDIEPASSTDGFTLAELYTALGNDCELVETLRLPNNKLLIFDEEGKGKHLDFNLTATNVCHEVGLLHSDYIVGNAICCDDNQLQ